MMGSSFESQMKASRSTSLRSWFAGLILGISGLAPAQEPVHSYSGDGWLLTVVSMDEETGEVSGEISFADRKAAYRGTIFERGGQESASCVYLLDDDQYRFEVDIHADDTLTLNINGGFHRLFPGAGAAGGAPGSASEGQAQEMSPNPSEPSHRSAASVETGAASLPEQLALKMVSFPDVTMGGVPAYTMLIPQEWKSEGYIEWSTSEPVYPHPRVRVTGPDLVKISFVPTMSFLYSEADAVPGFPKPPVVGIPAPSHVGNWLVEHIRENSPHKDVRLISDVRDGQAEASLAEVQRQLGDTRNQNASNTSHVVTYAYTADGQEILEETRLIYTRFPEERIQNMRSQVWMIYVTSLVSSRADRFEHYRPMLLGYAASFKSTPKWWNQMMQLRRQIFNAYAGQVAAAIAERGRHYDQISSEQYRAWKQQTSDDRSHRRHIQSIYEVQDYQDSNGGTVELPIHYKHVFSDGGGNYILSNRYNPPGGPYREIQPLR